MQLEEAIGEFDPAGEPLDIELVGARGRVTVDLDLVGGQFVFSLSDDSGTGLVGRSAADGYYLIVAERTDTIFDLYLAADKAWSFDERPFTLKQSDNAKYYKVDPDPADPRHIIVQARSTGLPPQPSGQSGVNQYFNLNVVMAQPTGPGLKVRIDPDTKNPPPNP